MSLILPKGFVVNSREIGEAVESIDMPLDLAEVARFWRVYNATRRRLLDPTAECLENYWWRIWGSVSSQLKGATVAKQFLEISDGDSFVPLRSSANRDEGAQSENITTPPGPEIPGTVTVQPPFMCGQRTTSFPTLSKVHVATMPPSILKKTGGPSTTGPRPNAYLASPHESTFETGTNLSIKVKSHKLHDVQTPLPENFSPDPLAPQRFKSRPWRVEESVPQAVAFGEPGPDGLDKLELRQAKANVFVKNQYQTSQNPWNGDLLQEEGQPHLSDSTIPTLTQVTRTKDEGQWKGDENKEINQVIVFDKIPVPHNSAGSLVGKSQLTLLLEKDSAKKCI